MNKFCVCRLSTVLLCLFLTSYALSQSFNSTGLGGENVTNPTSLQFGPNGKLYVSEQFGTIWEFTVTRDGAPAGNGTYTASGSVQINDIKTGVPNHNDDGTVSTSNKRQVTGLYAAGTAAFPVLYVSSSDARIGGANAGTDTNLDTNSGVLSRLTWNGSTWDRVDLVRGLPRCEENHSTNGMDIFQNGGSTYLLLQQGGNTNEGAPSNNFAGTSDTYLSGALLIINLTQLEGMPVFTDPRNGASYVYDLPTLNDPTRADITNADSNFPYPSGHPMFNATIDVGDPFGGNDGLNQAFAEVGGPVQIFSPGYRNAYDVVVTADGRIFSGDNGPNVNWGGPPVIRTSSGALKGDQSTTTYDPGAGDYITNEFNMTNGAVTIGDALHYVGNISDANNTYYAGHPVPIRAFPSRAGIKVHAFLNGNWVEEASHDWADLILGVSGYFQTSFTIADFPDDTRQGEYLAGNSGSPKVNILDVVSSSTNGLCEYTASNFGGVMTGNLLSASFGGTINRYGLNAAGTGLEMIHTPVGSGFGSIPLDVIAQGDSDPFAGTIWAVTYGANNITVFEPADFGTCLQPGDLGYDEFADSDSDGYTNGDEVANGTDHCNGGSKPNDNDLDLISDKKDPDDDNDGILDVDDVFAIDADNGTTTNLPINYPFWNNDPGTGFAGLGFTGWMNNGTSDYLDQYEVDNLTFGGAGGKATIDKVPEGNALGGLNTQQNGFQFGVNVNNTSPTFTVHSKIETPFGGTAPVDSQSYGIFIGNGDQDNYLKVVIMDGTTNGDGIDGFEVVLENGGTPTSNTFDAPNLLAATGIDIYINVDPVANTAQPFYSLDNGTTIVQLGTAVVLPSSFLDPNDNKGMAVGIISTSDGAGPEFTATWDFINVTEDGSADISVNPDPIDFGTLAPNSGVVEIIASALNTGGPSTGTMQITNATISGADAALFGTSFTTPAIVGPGSSTGIPVSFTPNGVEGAKTANLVITHTGLNSPTIIPLNAILSGTSVVGRINAGGAAVTASDGGMNWEYNADTGSYVGTTYSVNTGLVFNSNLTYANRHASIPADMDQATFEALFAQERYDPSGGADMNFSVPVANGIYTVNLFMGNSFSGTGQVGQRVFDIELEGTVLKNDLDLIVEFGDQSGGMLSLQTEVTDGVLNIVFLEQIESPLVNAIEVLAGGSQFPPIVLQPIADMNSEEGDSGTFLSVGATGGNPNENFTYSISGNPAGTNIEPTNGQVFGTITAAASTGGPNNNGIYTVTVTASKPGFNPDTENFTWNVLSNVWVDKNENENYTARHECSFVQAGDKFFLMGGRENAQTVDVYDYTTNTWVNLNASAPREFNHFQATEYQGLIWVIGAFGDNMFPNEVPEEFIWAFDPSNNEWIQGPQIPAARRRGSTGLVVQDNKFYIVGGNTLGHSGGYVPWFDEYDPATGVWTPLADAPRARDHFSATLIGNDLYLAGGRLSGGAGGVFAPTIPEVDVYNFGSGTWITLPAGQNIPTPRGGASTANFNGKLLVIGGEVQNEVVYNVNTTGALNITEEYDPNTQTWTRISDLNSPRHGTQAVVSGSGVFILAGSTNLGGGNQKNMEYLGIDNPIGAPSTTSSLSAPSSVLVSDGATEDIAVDVINGNVGVIVTSMQISGPNAADFTITGGELANQLLNAGGSHTVSVNLSGTGANRTATLTINYGNGDSITIGLANSDSSLNAANPGTQNNNEGDTVSLQIQATGASTYSATGLPPTLMIDPNTGLISGTISAGGANSGPFLEQGGLVVMEAESGTAVPTWKETTTDGATGIIAGSDHPSMQNGGTIPYQVTVGTPGVYRFNWRSFYSGSNSSEENDNWLRFPNNTDVWFFGFQGTPADEASLIANVTSATPTNIVFPIGSGRGTASNVPNGSGGNGYFKIFRSGGTSEVYDWQALTSDFDSHDIYVYFVNAGTYTMEISERSLGHAIDRIALYKVDGTDYTDAQLTAAAESQRAGGGGAADGSPYTVTVSVADNGAPPSNASAQFIWNIGEAGDPIAIATADPTSGFAPLDVNFTGSGSTDDVGIVSYLWDFDDGSPTSNVDDPMHIFTTVGTYNVRLTVTDGDSNTSTTDITITVTDPSAVGTIRINSGGPTYTFNGVDWNLDQYSVGGTTFENAVDIANTANDQLYQTERFSTTGTLTYEIPVVAGNYHLNLHFAELFFGLPGLGSGGGIGSRVFNINVENGQVQLDNYDIFSAAGAAGKAVIENFSDILVNDGNLTITLTGVVENPKISGIEVIIPGGDSTPVVYAGEDQDIAISSTTLDGSATDADGGGIASYVWTQISGPSTATLSGEATQTLVTSDLVEGVYIFRLTATDEENDTGFDEATITVANQSPTIRINSGGPNYTFNSTTWSEDQYFNAGTPNENIVAIANTANDQLYQTERYNYSGPLVYEIPVNNGDYNVNLHFAEIFYGVPGPGSSGGVGSRVFNVDIEGGEGTLTNYDIVAAAGGSATAIIENFTNITVNDGSLTITLTGVTEFPKISGIEVVVSGLDNAPVVFAGDDLTVTLSNNSLTLDGSATDPDGGTIVSYMWTQVSGPTTATFSSMAIADPDISDLVAGDYVFRLTATDDENDMASDEVTITVSSEPSSFLINAGGPAFTFNTEEWTADDYFIGGTPFPDTPNAIPIANTENDELYQTERYNTSGTLVYEIPVANGSYNVDLHFAELFYGVGGQPGGVGSRIFNIQVENEPQIDNYDIVAAAGGSATAIIESLSNVDVSDGMMTITLTSVTEFPKISGIRVFETRPPDADAGPDQTITLPENNVVLNGAGTDPDGGMVAYQWTQESGPGTAALTGDTTAELTVNGLVEGQYVFRLTITDDEGVTAFDEVTISVVPEGGMGDTPVAVAEATPTTGGAPLLVTFTGSNSTDNIGIASYIWDFGNGTTSTDADPEHIYRLPGTYDVVLTVTDDGGLTDTAELTITVSDDPRGRMDIILQSNPPNPADGGYAHIQVINKPVDVRVMNITLHDVGGRYVAGYLAEEIDQNGVYRIPIATLGDGIYFVRVVMNRGKSTLIKLWIRN